MAHSVNNLYTIDEKGWRTYDIDKMTTEQAKVVADTCPKEALNERIKTGLLAGGFAVALVASSFVALAIVKLSVVLFAVFVAKVGLHFGVVTGAGIRFTAQLLSGGFASVMGAYGIKVLWQSGIEKITQMWAYAGHLDQQGKDALLQKGYLESLTHVR